MNGQFMQPGKKYKIRHRSDTQRKDRTSVMRFLEAIGDDYIFDARPKHGTQKMPKGWVIGVHEVPDSVVAYCDRYWECDHTEHKIDATGQRIGTYDQAWIHYEPCPEGAK